MDTDFLVKAEIMAHEAVSNFLHGMELYMLAYAIMNRK